MTNAFLDEAAARGFIHQCTDIDGLAAALNKGPVSAYVGYDATADSLHVGSLVSIMLMRLLQRHGHRPVVLMGGGTTRIGDPSFKDEQRKMLSDAAIAANIAGIGRAFSSYLRFDGAVGGAMMANNADWLDKLGYIPLLRAVGPHFTINRMLAMDSVKLRLDREQSLSFLEFNYMILQSYDFLELHRRHGVQLQMGGSDQWGNIVCGVDLVRRIDGGQTFGLTTPLITNASGAKMGKTAAGAVWLNADRLSPYDYWQFWRNTEDADVGRFLRLFTDLPLSEIARLDTLGGAEVNEAKKSLANAATALLHGADAASRSADTARKVFEDGAAAETLPTYVVPRFQLEEGIPAWRLLALSGLVASNGEGRRLIAGGGARLNDVVLVEDRLVVIADLTDGVAKLSAGRKKHYLIRAE